MEWLKPTKPRTMDYHTYSKLPDSLLVREVRVRVEELGFRTTVLVLATTLLDAEAFTKAVNAGVISTQLCFERTEFGDCILERKRQVRRCVEKRDQGYNRCTEERDDGYNRCDASRDEGYSRCCDWAGCCSMGMK